MRLYRVTCLRRSESLVQYWEPDLEKAKARRQMLMETGRVPESEIRISDVDVPDDEESLARFLNELHARH